MSVFRPWCGTVTEKSLVAISWSYTGTGPMGYCHLFHHMLGLCRAAKVLFFLVPTRPN
jgi:hypothetical protein